MLVEPVPIRVVIVDDHPVLRSGLKAFLQAYEDMVLVGEAGDGEEAIQVCRQTKPDVVIMDLIMPGIDGVTATHAIRQSCPDSQVVVLSSYRDEDLIRRALQAGAISYLLKNVSSDELARAIRSAYAGRTILSPEAAQVLIQAATQPSDPVGVDLTLRERMVLALMVQGYSNAEIADQLVITYSTSKAHVSSILTKLKVSTRGEAMALAIQRHLVPAPGSEPQPRGSDRS